MRTRRAETGISFMIVFIAAIMVAAIAAGVFITTSSKLQQRSLVVGKEAEDRVSRGLQVVEVSALANLTTSEVYAFELLVRPLASSSSLTQGDVLLSIAGEDFGASAEAQSIYTDGFRTASSGTISSSPTSWTVFDVDEERLARDTVTYGLGNDVGEPTYGTTLVLVLTSDRGERAVFNLSGTYNNSHYAIRNDSSDMVYGYVNFSNNVYTFANAYGECDPLTQIRETKFCLEEVQGNGNAFLDKNEVWKITYRLKQNHYLSEAETIVFRFVPVKGYVSEISVRLPSVFDAEVMNVWP